MRWVTREIGQAIAARSLAHVALDLKSELVKQLHICLRIVSAWHGSGRSTLKSRRARNCRSLMSGHLWLHIAEIGAVKLEQICGSLSGASWRRLRRLRLRSLMLRGSLPAPKSQEARWFLALGDGCDQRLFDHGLFGRSWAREHQRDHLRLALMLCDEVRTRAAIRLAEPGPRGFRCERNWRIALR